MAELKTKANDTSVNDFLARISDEGRRQDAFRLVEMMRQTTSSEPRMWGDSIIGFGAVHLKYASGRELDWFKIGFSPRKQSLVLYGLGGFEESEDVLARLGKHKRGKGCLYINRLSDVDIAALKEFIGRSVPGE